MPLLHKPQKAQDWSSTLRDDDFSSDDDAGPRSLSTSRGVQTAGWGDEDDEESFAWGSTTDFVDIGMVDEPASLKFVETPFTLAKRTGAAGGKAARSVAKQKEKGKATVPPPSAKAGPAPPLASLPGQNMSQSASKAGPAAAAPPKTPAKAKASSTFKPLQPLSAAPVAPRAPVAPTPARKAVLPSSPTQKVDRVVAPPKPPKPSEQPVRAKLAPGTSAASPFRPSGPRMEPSTSSKQSSLPSVMADLLVIPFSSTLHISTPPTSPRPRPKPSKAAAAPASRDGSSSPLPQWQAPLLRPQPVKGFKQMPSPAPAPTTPSHRLLNAQVTVPPHRRSPSADTTARKRRFVGTDPTHASADPPSQGLAHSSGEVSHETRARLDRFRYIGNFGTTTKTSSPASATSSEPATKRSRDAASENIASAMARGGSTSTPTTARFTLAGLAPSSAPKRPFNRLAFEPAEPLSSFQARMSNSSRSSFASSNTHDDRDGREKVLLGAAVRSVKPILSTRFGGGVGKKRKVGKGVPLVVPRERAAQDEEEESAEARLRRLYRSLDG
ncbi:hypothetical protein RTBOTA2_005853 [Rhodotorula toruloides]|nr:hypothetical protein RTBOTA2_005853 [Rhodotorula toruloides]